MDKQLTHPIDYASRRKSLFSSLKKGIALFPSAPDLVRNASVHHAYRQDSNFFYVTGFPEPHSYCILAPNSKHPFQLFVQPRDKTKEMWEGKICGPEQAKQRYGADLALPSMPTSHFDEAFVAALLEADCLYYRLGRDAEMDKRVLMLMQLALRQLGRTGRSLWPIRDPDELLSELRLVKHKAEVERLQRASDISAEAHVSAMRIARPGVYEYEVEAVLGHAFRANGSERHGYNPIVASGPNACVLHYHENNRRMAQNELLLIDAGAEFDYYTADITRTFPVSGTFTSEQREVYSAVLNVQKACIKMAKPGKTMREIHLHATELLTEELRRLKVLKGPTAGLIKKRAFFPYYPHGTGHWLGMDVHDTGRYFEESLEKPRKLQPGMVFTVEPGLYFAPDASTSPARYKGIGVRIEDDILITATGNKVLTSAVPKEVEELESLCSQS